MISTGALLGLKIGNLARMANGCFKFTIYEGTNDEYITFCTPECAKVIDSYLAFRKKYEVLTPDSPLIREQFERDSTAKTRHLTVSNICSLLQSLSTIPESGPMDTLNTKEIMMTHGFRKYFNTILIQAGVKPVAKEMMLGHKVGMEGSYYRPSDEELLAEYQKAVDLLTMSEEKNYSGKLRGSKLRQSRSM